LGRGASSAFGGSPERTYSPGSDESAAWANCFIKKFSSYYGSRTALADVALVFPGQTVLASVSVFTVDAEKCLYDYLGWAQALTELHFQWDALPDDQLRLEPTSISENRLPTRTFPLTAVISVGKLTLLLHISVR
jgi:hypothetical protein